MNRENLLQIGSGTVALTISTVFAAAYNHVYSNNTAYSHPGAILPMFTQLFSTATPFGLPIPGAFAGLGFYLCRRKDADFPCRNLSHAAHLFSFAWVLLALWVWLLPYMAIGGLANE